MILIDANALVILIIGLIDPQIINKHKRTSLYEPQDYEELLAVVGNINNLVVLPNVWTEVDNLLNDFGGSYKYPYIEVVTAVIQSTTEVYIPSSHIVDKYYFLDIGITDSLLLEQAQRCKLLITADSKLSDYASALGIQVYDTVKIRNARL